MDHRIAQVREDKSVKQADLARSVGISRGQLSNIEQGRRDVTLAMLKRMAKVLGVSVDDLLLPEDAPNHPSEGEAAILEMLREFSAYDPRAVVAATRAVITAFGEIEQARTAPSALTGDVRLTTKLQRLWNSSQSDAQREKILAFMETAREFS